MRLITVICISELFP